jgi:hypothetical protein
VATETRQLIRRMSRENPLWGAPRIHGELLKLGIDIGETSVSKYTVRGRITVHPAMKIGEPTLQPGFILLPRHTIYSGRGLPLQCVKAVPEQIQSHMMEQSGEPFLLPYRCCLSHTA